MKSQQKGNKKTKLIKKGENIQKTMCKLGTNIYYIFNNKTMHSFKIPNFRERYPANDTRFTIFQFFQALRKCCAF